MCESPIQSNTEVSISETNNFPDNYRGDGEYEDDDKTTPMEYGLSVDGQLSEDGRDDEEDMNEELSEDADDDEEDREEAEHENDGEEEVEVELGFKTDDEMSIKDYDDDGNMLPNNEGAQPPLFSGFCQSVLGGWTSPGTMSMGMSRASDLLMSVLVGVDPNKTKITKLAVSSVEELRRKALEGEPLWQPRLVGEGVALNEAEYARQFRSTKEVTMPEIYRLAEARPSEVDIEDFFSGSQYKNSPAVQAWQSSESERDVNLTEGSREVGFVSLHPTRLVKCLMDLKEWSTVFSNIVSKATLLGFLSAGEAESYDGTLLVMRAEFHFPTPFVTVREYQFARYSKQLDPGTWVVVDVSIDDLFPYPTYSEIRFRRRPSGCLIQEMEDGQCKVTWVEHVEVSIPLPRLFRSMILSCQAFGAKRWIAGIIRHSENIAASIIASPLTKGQAAEDDSLLRLVRRMTTTFCQQQAAYHNNVWETIPLQAAESIKLRSSHLVLANGEKIETIIFTSSIWLPVPPRKLFEYLKRPESRRAWERFPRSSRVETIHEFLRIPRGPNRDNLVSVLEALDATGQREVMHLQESFNDPIGYYIVFAQVDYESVVRVLGGGDPDTVDILPSGFVIHPDKAARLPWEPGGSIITIGFNFHDPHTQNGIIPELTFQKVYRMISQTSYFIRTALIYDFLVGRKTNEEEEKKLHGSQMQKILWKN